VKAPIRAGHRCGIGPGRRFKRLMAPFPPPRPAGRYFVSKISSFALSHDAAHGAREICPNCREAAIRCGERSKKWSRFRELVLASITNS
jgi:hypothetical protein